MDISRLEQQIEFLIEIDKLKQITRRCLIMDGERYENTAEHSWHVALMAMIMAEHADFEVNILHVIKMLLIHDLVEIDAGDTYLYDDKANEDKTEREQAAADRIFGLLPDDQALEIRQLWEEFEAHETAEARFALALDRILPMLNNYCSNGKSWIDHGVKSEQVKAHNKVIQDGSDVLWKYSLEMIQSALKKGYLKE